MEEKDTLCRECPKFQGIDIPCNEEIPGDCVWGKIANFPAKDKK